MVIEHYKKNNLRYIDMFASYFLKWSPSSLTLLSFIFAILSFFFFLLTKFSYYFLFFVSAAVLFSGFFDMIDGSVARKTGKTSRKGDLMDHVLDRYSDLIIMCGFLISGLVVYPYLVIVSMIGILLTSYMGTQAQALGISRLYEGLLIRADRLVLFIIFPFFEMVMLSPISPIHYFTIYSINFTLFDILFLYIAIASNFTALQRFYIIWKAL